MTIGTDTAPWAASFFLQSVVVNGHVKVRLLHTEPLTISVSAGAYHATVPASGTVIAGSGSLLLVPASLYSSSDLTKRVSLHLGVTYAHVGVDGEVELQTGTAPARGALAANAVQLHAMVEWRVSRLVALTLVGHAQPVSSQPAVHLSATTTYGDRFELVGTVAPVDRTALAAIGSVVLSGKHMNFRIGGGYGAVFLPSGAKQVQSRRM